MHRSHSRSWAEKAICATTHSHYVRCSACGDRRRRRSSVPRRTVAVVTITAGAIVVVPTFIYVVGYLLSLLKPAN